MYIYFTRVEQELHAELVEIRTRVRMYNDLTHIRDVGPTDPGLLASAIARVPPTPIHGWFGRSNLPGWMVAWVNFKIIKT